MATASQKERAMYEGFETLGDASKTIGGNIGEDVKDVGRQLGGKAETFASNIADQAEHATGAVGTCMESFAETIREHSPKEGMLGSASQAISEKFEKGGQYLEEKGLKGMGEDITDLIRSNPVPALLVGIGLGFLLAKMMRS